MDLDTVKHRIADAIHSKDNVDQTVTLEQFEIPKDRQHGDLALPCFFLAKALKMNPAAIAAGYAEHLSAESGIDAAVDAAGPYLNITVAAGDKTQSILSAISDRGPGFGGDESGTGKTLVIDFSSPNIAKPFGFGHLRTTIIGNALSNIYACNGWTIQRINHLGDWGKQYGLLDVAFRKWGDEEQLTAAPIMHLYDLYVRVNREIEAGDAELDEEGRQAFRALENNEAEVTARWRRFCDLSIAEFKKVYNRLDIAFDSYAGEAAANPLMPGALERLEAKGLLVESEGARGVDLEDAGLGFAILEKSNGSTTYLTRDIAVAEKRWDDFHFDRMLYVVGQPQELHFRQLFEILRRMDYAWVENCGHIMFGYIRGMSTRKGTIVFLDDVLDEARDRVEARMEALNIQKIESADAGTVAEKIGITAVLFSDLKSRRIKDIDFDWDRILSLQGDTGPYLQNALARIYGVFRKAAMKIPAVDEVDFTCLEDVHAQDLVDVLGAFPRAVEDAVRLDEPSMITGYLLNLAKGFHSAYNELMVKGSEPAVAGARLFLFDCVRQVLENGFQLLGFKMLKTM